MNLKRMLPAWILAGWMLVSAGCASPPAEVRIQGVVVPSSWVERAETGSGSEQAQACLSLSKRLWDRDVLESLRYLRRGAELRNQECCRQYLASAESASVNLSQRVYARLFLEGLLRKGPVLSEAEGDIRGDLFAQLGWAWAHTEPVSLYKAKQVLEAMLEIGVPPASTSPALVSQMLRDAGLRARPGSRARDSRNEVQMYAGEGAEDSRFWLQMTAGVSPGVTVWADAQAEAWGGGSDRLLLGTGVLAFLVNAAGEPSFRGDHLWICNLGASPVYLTSLAVGRTNHELVPGRIEVISLSSAGYRKAEPTTGIPLSIRYRRMAR